MTRAALGYNEELSSWLATLGPVGSEYQTKVVVRQRDGMFTSCISGVYSLHYLCPRMELETIQNGICISHALHPGFDGPCVYRIPQHGARYRDNT